MIMGGIMTHPIMAPNGTPLEYFVNVVANISFTGSKITTGIARSVTANVTFAGVQQANAIGKVASAAMAYTVTKQAAITKSASAALDLSVSATKAIVLNTAFVAAIDYAVSATKAIARSVTANVTFAGVQQANAISKGASAAISFAATKQANAITKGASAAIAFAVTKQAAIAKSVSAAIDFAVNATRSTSISAVANMTFSFFNNVKKEVTISAPFQAALSLGVAFKSAIQRITDLDILQLPINAVLAHKYLFKKSGDTVEKRDPNYKFERMASRRTGVRRLNRGDGPSFTTKTDKKGYD